MKFLPFIIIAISLVSIVAVNFQLWPLYVAHQTELSTGDKPLKATVWGYLESDPFKGITTGLTIPIIFALIENQFKIIEKNRERKENEKKERIERNRERRWTSIEESTSLWNKLIRITSNLAHFDISDSDGKKELRKISSELLTLTSEGDAIVNAWSYRFKNLSNFHLENLLPPINILIKITSSIIEYLEESIPDADKIQMLKNLSIIQNGIKQYFIHSYLRVLKDSLNLLEILDRYDIPISEYHKANPTPSEVVGEFDVLQSLKDDGGKSSALEKLSKDEKQEVKKLSENIDESMMLIRDWTYSIFYEIQKNHDVFPLVNNSKSITSFRKSRKEVIEQLTEKKYNEISQRKSQEFMNFRKILDRLDITELLSPDIFSIKTIKNIAVWFSKYSLEADVVSYATSLKIIPWKSNKSYMWNILANRLIEKSKFLEANKYYDKALNLNPNDPVVLRNKGISLANLKQYKDAIEYYDKSLELDPNDPLTLSSKDISLHYVE